VQVQLDKAIIVNCVDIIVVRINIVDHNFCFPRNLFTYLFDPFVVINVVINVEPTIKPIIHHRNEPVCRRRVWVQQNVNFRSCRSQPRPFWRPVCCGYNLVDDDDDDNKNNSKTTTD